MAYIPPIPSDSFLVLMQRTLTEGLRRALKEPLMELAEEYVDRAVEHALTGLKSRIEASVDTYSLEKTIKVIVENAVKKDTAQ